MVSNSATLLSGEAKLERVEDPFLDLVEDLVALNLFMMTVQLKILFLLPV